MEAKEIKGDAAVATRLVQILKTCPTQLQMIANQDLKATQASLCLEVTVPAAQSAVCGGVVAAGLQSAARDGTLIEEMWPINEGPNQKQRSILFHPPRSSSLLILLLHLFDLFPLLPYKSLLPSFFKLAVFPARRKKQTAAFCVGVLSCPPPPAPAAPPTSGSILSDIGRYWHVFCALRMPSFFPHASCLLLLFSYNSLHLPEQIRRHGRVFQPCA